MSTTTRLYEKYDFQFFFGLILSHFKRQYILHVHYTNTKVQHWPYKSCNLHWWWNGNFFFTKKIDFKISCVYKNKTKMFLAKIGRVHKCKHSSSVNIFLYCNTGKRQNTQELIHAEVGKSISAKFIESVSDSLDTQTQKSPVEHVI